MKLMYSIFLFICLLLISCQPKVIDQEEIVYVEKENEPEIIDPNKVRNPIISPIGGVFYDMQKIDLTCDTKGATIIYTTDGSNPSRENGIVYKENFNVNIFSIIKVFAIKEGLADSNIVRSAYSFKVTGLNYSVNDTPITSSTETFYSDISLRIYNYTDGSAIYYTTDGSTPTSSSNLYTSPLTFSEPITIKSIAYKYGWSYSEMKTINFKFKVEPLNIYPNGGNYDSTVDVVLSPSIYGAKIYYTLDGSDPTTDSKVYSGPIKINKDTVIKAIGTKAGMENSEVCISNYTVQISPEKTQKPILSAGSGLYISDPEISLTSPNGAVMKYSMFGINDTEPTILDETYEDGATFTISDSTKLKVVAFKDGLPASDPVIATYYVNPGLTQLSLPTADVDDGNYSNEIIVTLTSPDGATIRYTTDGSTPSKDNGTVYENPLKLDRSTQLKAVCLSDNKANSNILVKNYTIEVKVEKPEITSGIEDGGVYSSAVKLEVNSPTYNSIVRYTINGLEPTENDFVLNGPLSLVSGEKTLNIKVKAFKNGWIPSETIALTITFKLPDPSFTPQETTFKKVANLIISQPVLGATTRYTLDGTKPSITNGITYDGKVIVLKQTTRIWAISYKTGWEESKDVTCDYVLKTN